MSTERMTTRTPGPWRACHGGDCRCHMIWSVKADVPVAVTLTDKDERYTCGEGPIEESARANARFIVTACNAHESLVEALRDVVDNGEGCITTPPCGDCRWCRARAVLEGLAHD